MSRFAKLFAANAIAAAGLCSAALALSPSAAAEPAPAPVVPQLPALNMIQQFATNPASMGAVLQTAATALNGASALVGGSPASTLPVSPIEGAPATPPVAAPGPGSSLLPLLNSLGVPASLANLGPSQMPFPIQIGDTLGISPAPVATAPPARAPAAAPPILPAVPPAAGGVGGLLPLSALP